MREVKFKRPSIKNNIFTDINADYSIIEILDNPSVVIQNTNIENNIISNIQSPNYINAIVLGHLVNTKVDKNIIFNLHNSNYESSAAINMYGNQIVVSIIQFIIQYGCNGCSNQIIS